MQHLQIPARIQSQRFDGSLATTACVAIVIPTLIAYNISPSATFFNQAAAFIGWGGFVLMIGLLLPRAVLPTAPASIALLCSLVCLVAAALGTSIFASAPWSLSLSSAGTIAAAVLVVAVAASAQRAHLGGHVFHAFCVALVVAGIFSSVIGLVQVFAPNAPDGEWVALSAIPGRATGNLRQPNHLSSLLLWSIVGAVWLGEVHVRLRWIAVALVAVFIYVVVLSASRTGAVGMLTLAAWGLFDRRLSSRSRALLLLAPILYGAGWWGTTVWANSSHHLFGGQTRFGGSGDISSSRFGIWSNTLSLIAMHPLLGVGFGEFNFAWTLTPFPHRPVAFFDHTHNLVLNFMVELGIPLALFVLGMMTYALWRALKNAIADGRERTDATVTDAVDVPPAPVPIQRAAFVIVIMVAVHSMLEYPLWYSYFLLPAAFAFGLCLERPERGAAPVDAMQGSATRPYVLASMFLVMAAGLSVYDYLRVSMIFAPPTNASPLEKRIADGRKSVLFAHHADYAAATIDDQPGKVIGAFDRSTHYLLDARLMMSWAKALDQVGETDKARYIAARLKEFHNEQADEFFAVCDANKSTEAVAPAASAASDAVATSSTKPPFQCEAPQKAYRYEDFR